MSYGTLLTGAYTARDGTRVDVYVDLDGYSGTTYTADIKQDRLDVGQSGGALFAPTRRSRSTVTFLAAGAVLTEVKKVPQQPYTTHRLRVEHDSTEVYRGYVVPNETTSRINETRRSEVTIRANVNLAGLSAEWRKPDGTAYTGELALSAVVAGIFDSMGLAAPLDAVIDWRPAGMTASDDPLSVRAQADAWTRSNDEGQLSISARQDVLEDIVGIFGASIHFEDGVWRIRQPTAYRTGSNVLVHTYDAAGVHQGSVSRASTSALTGEGWKRETDEVSGVQQVQEARITFEHGAPSVVDFNGSFEDGPEDDPDGWTLPTSDFGTSPLSPNSDSDRSLEITGESKLSPTASDADMKAAADEVASATIGGYASGSEEIDLTLYYKTELGLGGNRGVDTPDAIRLYWAVSHTSISGTVYWFVEGSGWVAEGNLSVYTDRLNALITGPSGSTWLSTTVVLPSPPQVGTLALQLAEPVSRLSTTGETDYTFAAYWDECAISRKVDGSSETLFVAADPSATGGRSLERTFRIGDGPYETSPGALKTPSGDFTGAWSVVGESGSYAIHELLAREMMRSLRQGAQLDREKMPAPSTRPYARRAVDFDDGRWWPVQVRRVPYDEEYTLALVQLADHGQPPNVDIIGGGEDSFTGGGTTGGSTGASSSVSWSDISGLPSQLFSRNGGDDGIAETIALAASDIISALGFTPPGKALAETISGAWVFDGSAGSGWPFQVHTTGGDAKSGESAEWLANFCHDGTSLNIGVRSAQGRDDLIIKALDPDGTRPKIYLGSSGGGEMVIDSGHDKVGMGGVESPTQACDVAGKVRGREGMIIEGYAFAQDGNGDLVITTPSGNKIRLGDDGEVEAFA
jgi:hypothetical protein